MKIDPDSNKMTAQDYKEGTFTIPITGKGGPVWFNLKYLLSFAQQFGTIQLTGKGRGDPAMIQCEDPAFLGVLMPMWV